MVLGPVLYFGLQPIHPVPFHRAMDRAFLVSALGALGLCWKEIPWAQAWRWRRDTWRRILLGYLFAFVSAQAIIGLDLALCGFHSAHLSGSEVASRVLMAVIAALLVPPLEETVFRAFLAHELGQNLGRRWGCILSAVIFMLAHFLKVPVELDHQPVHFWSGATAVGAALVRILQGAFLGWRGLNLFLIGIILGGIFLHTRTLWVNAGLHSGWILALLLFSGLTRPMVPARVEWLAGGDLLSTPITSLVLIISAVWIWRYYLPLFDISSAGESAPLN